MQKSEYEPVDKIRLGNQRKEPSFKEGMQLMELSTLKAQNKVNEKEITTQKKEIDKSITDAKKSPLPKNTLARFDREFGKAKEKNAYKTAIVLFFVAILLSFFIQPSIFFVKDQNDLKLINYTQREIKNLSIYSFNDLARGQNKPVFFIEKLYPHTVLPIVSKETTVFLAFADRQMPAIGVFTLSNQNINNDGNANNYKTGQTPEEMLNEMMGNKGADTNG
jgi:hypothetical protein